MLTNEQIVEMERQINDYSYLKTLCDRLGYDEDFFIFLGKICALRVALDTLGYIIKTEKEVEKNGIKYKYYILAEKEKGK